MARSESYYFNRRITGIVVLAIKLILLVSLALGSTLAVFTAREDRDIQLSAAQMGMKLYRTDEALGGEYVEMDGAEGDAFEGIEWEPGATRLLFLKVENKGTISINYILRFVANVEDLYGAFEFCAFEGDYSMLSSLKASSWQQLKETYGSTTLVTNENGERISDENRISGSSLQYLEIDEADYFVIALHMRESVGNAAQSKSCTVKFNLYAQQANVK